MEHSGSISIFNILGTLFENVPHNFKGVLPSGKLLLITTSSSLGSWFVFVVAALPSGISDPAHTSNIVLFLIENVLKYYYKTFLIKLQIVKKRSSAGESSHLEHLFKSLTPD